MPKIRQQNFASKNLESWAHGLLCHVGFDDLSAKTTAEGLVMSDLRGVESHGIRLLPHYVRAGQAGRLTLNPKMTFEQTAASTGIVDANHGLGFPAGQFALAKCREMATANGTGSVSIRNSSHGGMLAYYALAGAISGFLTLVVTNTTPRLIPPNAKKPFLGTNPFCYAVPLKDEGPLCYDAATTQITGNKIKLYRQKGKQLPDNVAADRLGNPTVDPMVAELLYPFGDYKGFGISMLVDILCGAFACMPNSSSVSEMYGNDVSEPRRLGQFILMVDIARFRPLEDFMETMQDEVNRLRQLPTHGDLRALAPGDPEKEIAAERSSFGIPLSTEIFDSLNEISAQVGFIELKL